MANRHSSIRSDAFCIHKASLFVPKAVFAKQDAAIIRCNDAFVLPKVSLIVDGAAFIVRGDALVDQNDAFSIEKASFCIQKEAFAFLDAPNVVERATFDSTPHRSREIGASAVRAAAEFVGRPSACGRPPRRSRGREGR